MPRSKGVYFFRSHVSVAAWPPAIHRTTRQSAVASSFFGSARRCGASRAAAPAAPAARRKSRRFRGRGGIFKTLRGVVGEQRGVPPFLFSPPPPPPPLPPPPHVAP